MDSVYRLTPVLKHYDWGSDDAIPALLGLPATGEPVAEAWWGAHPAFPSMAQVGGREVPLTEVLRDDAVGELGAAVAERWAGELPYLVKVLGVARPLSIQVHPSRAQAVAGFEAEERAGVPVDGAARSFRDRSHKPELLVALTDMTALVGFRPMSELAADLQRIGGPQARELSALVQSSNGDYTAFTRAVLALPRGADVLVDMENTADESASSSHRAAAHALTHHPGDPGALMALALNVVSLSPGQSVFTGDGIMHSYQSGVGLEVMANSDNVVRGGLTSKHIDVELLCALSVMTAGGGLDATPDGADGIATFRTPTEEFLLTTVTGTTAQFAPGPYVVIVLDGDAHVSTAYDTFELSRGDAVFVGHRDGPFDVTSVARVAVVRAAVSTN